MNMSGRISVCLVAVAVNTGGYAAEIGFEAGLFQEKNSNIFDAPINPTDETTRRAYGAVRIDELGPILESRTDARVTRYDYKNNTYSDNTVSTLETLNTVWIMPRTLNIDIDDHLAYVPIDASGLLVPTNQQQVNLFSIGPSFFANISPVDTMQLGYHYLNYSEEVSNADSRGDFAAALYTHKLALKDELHLNVEYRNTNFKDELYQDYDKNDWYASYQHEDATNNYYAEYGKTKVKHKGGIQADNNRLGLRVLHRMNRSNALELTFREQLTDTAQELSYTQMASSRQPVVISNIQVSNATDVFLVKSAQITYSMIDAAGGIRISAAHNKIDYLQPTPDENNTTYMADVTLPLSDAFSANAVYSLQDREFIATRNVKTRNARLTLSYRLSHDFSLNGYIAKENSDSTDLSYTYTNKQYGIGLVYQTAPMRNTLFTRRYSIP